MMKKFLLAAAAIMFSFTAEAEWKHKPIQCTETKKIYSELIDRYNLKPMFAGVANIRTFAGEFQPAVVIFFMNIDDGRFLFLEKDNFVGYSCVTQFGDGIDFNITEEEIRQYLLSDETT